MAIDINTIDNNIRVKHQEFMVRFGSAVEKVLADQRLIDEIALAKIKYVMNRSIDIGVIDHLVEVSNQVNKTLELSKDGSNNKVFMIINGNYLIVRGATRNIGYDVVVDSNKIIYRNIIDEAFDWVSFADAMLSFIHEIIYERSSALDVKLDFMFK